jgi:transcriptional regulator with XRE-family HTH domain
MVGDDEYFGLSTFRIHLLKMPGMNEINSALGAIIRVRREAKGLSQEAFADRAGIHRTYVSQLERGLKSPTIVILNQISRALDTRASRILQQLEKRVDIDEVFASR